MEIDITQIVVAVIGLLSVIVTSVVVPLIKSKLTNSQWEQRSREICLGQGVHRAAVCGAWHQDRRRHHPDRHRERLEGAGAGSEAAPGRKKCQ